MRMFPSIFQRFTAAGLLRGTVTILTPFAGRDDIFPRYLDAVSRLLCDPAAVRIHWYNTSEDPAFDRKLRAAITMLPFTEKIYTRAPLPAAWKLTPKDLIRNRIGNDDVEEYYQLAVLGAYNAMIRSCTTEYALTLEDDMAPSPSALKQMLDTMEPGVAAVVAPYQCGFYPRTVVWRLSGRGEQETFKTFGSGIQDVGGSGFGCSLFRMRSLRKIAPLRTEVRERPKRWYDQIAYLNLRRYGRILCNWDVAVEHLETERYAHALHARFT